MGVLESLNTGLLKSGQKQSAKPDNHHSWFCGPYLTPPLQCKHPSELVWQWLI